MKRKAQEVGERLRRRMTRKALVTMLLAGLLAVLAGMGAWTHTVYAAKVRAEETARKQAATLDQVMAKLNQMQTQMQAQADLTNAKLETLRYANAKLASYLLRTNAREARIEHAVAFLPASPMGAGGGGNTNSVTLQAQLCGQAAVNGELKYGPAVDLKGYARGNIGVDEFGDGIEADVRLQSDRSLEASFGGSGGLNFQVCYQFNPKVGIPSGVDITTLSNNVDTATQQVATNISNYVTNHPNLTGSNLPNLIGNLDTFQVSVNPQDILNAVEDPKQTLNEVSGLIQNLPVGGNLSSLISNPTAIFPQPGDLNPEALCGSSAAASGFLYYTCNAAPSVITSLTNVTTAVNNLTGGLSNLQTRLTNVETGVSNTCGYLNTTLSNIDNTSVSFNSQTLTSPLGFVTGVSWNGLTSDPIISVSKSYPSVTLPALSVDPFHFSQVSCPSF